MATQKLLVLRQLCQELRRSSYAGKVGDSPIFQYIFEQYRKYQVTDQQLCKAQEEMHYLANTYQCYLKSQRLFDHIYEQYHAKGERTVKETADMVGFKLPHDPK